MRETRNASDTIAADSKADVGSWLTAKNAALLLYCVATALLIPMKLYVPGVIAGLGCALLLWRSDDGALRRRLGVLLAMTGLLTVAPIHTDTGNSHFTVLGLFFLAAILIPSILLSRTDPGTIDFRIWPRKFRWIDIFYVALAVPLAYYLIRIYFFQVNPDMPTQWPLPEVYDAEEVWRLVIGLNCVGIWDELFFVNIVFAVLRTLFPFRVANLAQAVIYTSVLYDMAFIGMGPFLVYFFALTQGSMYEQSKCLLYVLIVHLVIDAFLLESIIEFYYPLHGSFHWF